MIHPEPNINVSVDVTNPGQFFACCGLLELADRLWPGAEGWFGASQFCVLTADRSDGLRDLLGEVQTLSFDLGDDDSEDSDEEDHDTQVKAILLRWKDTEHAILLDWWADKSIKPWAGSMKERPILHAMLRAIAPNHSSPFDDLRAASDPSKSAAPRVDGKKPRKTKPSKREPFYFDPRRGNKAHPLDSGFSPDTHKMASECCSALEALCFIGLQRARPASTGIANQSRYTVWSQPITANLLGAVACGIVFLPGSLNYVFNNYFRTDQRKHKTFSQATLERSSNG